MISQLYSILDRGVQAFHAPVVAPNETYIRRSLGDLFSQDTMRPVLERHNYVRYPEEFDLYHVGTFDTESGAVEPVSPIVRVCNLADFIIGG